MMEEERKWQDGGTALKMWVEVHWLSDLVFSRGLYAGSSRGGGVRYLYDPFRRSFSFAFVCRVKGSWISITPSAEGDGWM